MKILFWIAILGAGLLMPGASAKADYEVMTRNDILFAEHDGVRLLGNFYAPKGVEKAPVIQKFLSGMPTRFEAASGNPILHGVIVTADDASGKATGITRLSLTFDELDALAADLPDEKAAAGRG